MNYLLVFLGGGAGCCLRFGISNLFCSKAYSLPWSTLISNGLSCVILILVMELMANNELQQNWLRPALIIGFCGGFSTFSTFSIETIQLLKNGNPWVAIFNVVLNLSICLWVLYRWSK